MDFESRYNSPQCRHETSLGVKCGQGHGEPHTIINYGPYPEGWSTTPPPPTPEEQQATLLSEFTAAIQDRLDAFARTRNYDGIFTAATYATDPMPKFATEGRYAVEARSATWAKGYEIMDAVTTGKRPMPTWEALEAELPKLKWPV